MSNTPQPNAPTLPDWFIEAFRQAILQLNWTLLGWEGNTAVVSDDEREGARYGLENAYRKTVGIPQEERVTCIIEHLSQVRNVTPLKSMAAARERLYPRLRAPISDEELASQLWSVPFQDTGLILVLVVDHPDAVTYVTRDMIEESGRSGEDWLELAIDNLRLITSPDQAVEVGEGGLYGVGTVDAYDASRALILEQFVDDPDPRGYIVSIPNRDRLYFYSVADNPFDSCFAGLLIETLKNHDNGAYPICDDIFWIHEGSWHKVGWEWDGEDLMVDWPPALKAMFEEEEE